MADHGVPYPSVYVVDSGHAAFPPLPPKPGFKQAQNRRSQLIQKTLLVLVLMALLGVAVEACFLYNLYYNQAKEEVNESPKADAMKGDDVYKTTVMPKTKRPVILHPPRPLAHLTAGSTKPGPDNNIMPWNMDAQPDMYKLEYKDGKLIVQKEGYYYIYSKMTFSGDNDSFIHQVEKKTQRYRGGSITLLRSSKYQQNKGSRKGYVRNSYLGGVFHLLAHDEVFVTAREGNAVLLQDSADNFFGMFML